MYETQELNSMTLFLRGYLKQKIQCIRTPSFRFCLSFSRVGLIYIAEVHPVTDLEFSTFIYFKLIHS